MSFKKLGRIICCTVMAAAVSAAAALSGCTIETKHPRAEITIEFDGTEYVIEYTLYRNMYPQTVRHFIELAESGFYDNTIIHDYTSTDWFGGGYDYDEEAYADSSSSEDMDNYLEEYDKAEDYIDLFNDGKLTASVYKNYTYDGDEMVVDEDTAYWTLRGEFEDNGHYVDNGALTASFGVLKMYYYSDFEYKESEAASMVYVKTSNDETVFGTYKYNSATSLFAVQVGSSSNISASSYCVFAELRNDDAEETLEDLLEAIDDYIDDYCNGEDEDFVQDANDVYVVNNDDYVQPLTVSFDVPVEPIIIKSVKITRY